jgi:hypothetical protein
MDALLRDRPRDRRWPLALLEACYKLIQLNVTADDKSPDFLLAVTHNVVIGCGEAVQIEVPSRRQFHEHHNLRADYC